MNVYGVGGAPRGLAPPQQDTIRRAATERPPAAATRRAEESAPRAAAPGVLAPSGPALPAEAPAGTDPELWSVLGGDERAFFAQAGGIGPLTYSHMIHSGAPATAVARGGRIDVRA